MFALLAAEMLSFLAGDAVVEVLCDQRFTLAASWAALERRRLWWLEVVEAVEAVWGGSALAAVAMLEAAPARASGCSDRLLLRLTWELLREFVRDGRRRCVLLAGALMLVRGEAAVCLRPRRSSSCTASRLGAGTRWRRRRGTGVLWRILVPQVLVGLLSPLECLAEARSTVYMWRLAKHSRETVPTGVHTPGVAAILKQSTLDARHGTTAPCRVGYDLRRMQLSIYCLYSLEVI